MTFFIARRTVYSKLNWLSVFSIFMLFVLGGLVRSTGSGMGCPDWPKCFGEYIPPTSESQLPSDYEDYYQDQRIKKTERFTLLLDKIGLHEKADAIRKNQQVKESHKFNVSRAYVEYINRLAGALTGIVVFLCFIYSFGFFKTQPIVFWLSFLGFIGVFANALLGAIVVSSNLIGGIVTAHFIGSFLSICSFMLARRYVLPKRDISLTLHTKIVYIVVALLSFTQVVIGANLREVYDLLPVSDFGDKIECLYPNLQIHAILGSFIMVLSIYLFVKSSQSEYHHKYLKYLLILSIAQMVFGPMALWDQFAAISKLFHISIGAGIFVIQFYICTTLINKGKNTE